MGNAKPPTSGPVEAQARSLVKVLDNSDRITFDAEVSFDRAMDTEVVFLVLANAASLDLGGAFLVGGDNAELEFQEVLAAKDAANQKVAVRPLGHETIEGKAQQLKGLVLLDFNIGNTLIGVKRFVFD